MVEHDQLLVAIGHQQTLRHVVQSRVEQHVLNMQRAVAFPQRGVLQLHFLHRLLGTLVRRLQLGQGRLQVGDVGADADDAAVRRLALGDQDPAMVRQLAFHRAVVAVMPGDRSPDKIFYVVAGLRILAALAAAADDVLEPRAGTDELRAEPVHLPELLGCR